MNGYPLRTSLPTAGSCRDASAGRLEHRSGRTANTLTGEVNASPALLQCVRGRISSRCRRGNVLADGAQLGLRPFRRRRQRRRPNARQYAGGSSDPNDQVRAGVVRRPLRRLWMHPREPAGNRRGLRSNADPWGKGICVFASSTIQNEKPTNVTRLTWQCDSNDPTSLRPPPHALTRRGCLNRSLSGQRPGDPRLG